MHTGIRCCMCCSVEVVSASLEVDSVLLDGLGLGGRKLLPVVVSSSL